MVRTLRRNETIDDLKKPAKGKPYYVADSSIANLLIKVSSKKTMFIMSVRFGDNKHPTRRTIGNASVMSLDAARAVAVKWNDLNRRRIDPTQHFRDEAIEKERLERRTLRSALEDYICWLPERDQNRSALQEQRSMRREFLDPQRNPFLSKKVSQVSAADIQTLIKNIVTRGAPGQAYTMFGSLKTFFNWLLEPIQSQWYGIEHSPCDRLKFKTMGIRKNARDRALTSREIRAYWSAAEDTPSPWGEFFKVLLLCGQRKNEVAGAAWPEIDWSKKIWSIPECRFKSNRVQPVPLSIPILQILEHIRSTQTAEHGPFIFSTADGRTRIRGLSKSTKKFRQLLREKYAALYPDDPDVPHWIIHDLRRTVRSSLTDIGVPTEVAEAVIGHEQAKLLKIYNTSKFRSQRRRAIYLWGEEVKRILDDPLYDHQDEDRDLIDWPSRWNNAK